MKYNTRDFWHFGRLTVSQLVSSESREWTGSPTELAEAVNTGMAANALTKYLNVKSGRLLDEYHVRYENRAKHSGRQVKLTHKSVHRKLRAAELERENTELRGKVRSYEDVIQRNNLWRFFHPHREKAVTRDEAR